MSNRTTDHRAASRARKEFARFVSEAVHAKAERHAARTVATAERRAKAHRRRYLEALRLEASEAGAWA